MRAGGLLVAVTLLAGVASLAADGLLERVEHGSIDARFRVRGPTAAPRDLVVIALDNRSLRRLGVRPPLARSIQARLIDRLDRAGARVIAFDFSLEQSSGNAVADRRLVVALMNARHAVVSVTAPSPGGGVADLAGFIPLRDTGVLAGYTGLRLDSDGVIRRFPPGAGGVPPFSMAVAQSFTHRQIAVPPGALIDFPGPSRTVPQISYSDVLDGSFPARRVRGKIAVVGPTATVIGDTHRAAADASMTGAEIHAAAIATALDHFPLRAVSAPVRRGVGFAVGLAVALLLAATALPTRRLRARHGGGALLATPGPTAAALAGALVLGAWLVTSQLVFDAGTVLPLVPGTVAALTATIALMLFVSELSRRERRALRIRFAAGVPSLGDRVLASTGRPRAVTSRDIIGGYILRSPLGGGGMGVVWSATQIRLDREIALKLIRPEYATSPGYRKRFVQEAYRASAISHPNVIPLIDAGEADGVLFVAMPRVIGTDLMRIIGGGGAVDAHLALAILEPVARALDYVWERHDGLLHRDVKPSNIFIPEASPTCPFLLDFGLAMTAAEAAVATLPAGSKPYLAPERWAGVEGRAADVYALAATLFHCLTAVAPFAHTRDDELRRAHENAPRPLVSDRRPDIPPTVDLVVASGMAADPERRYPTAEALLRAFAIALWERRSVSQHHSDDAAPPRSLARPRRDEDDPTLAATDPIV